MESSFRGLSLDAAQNVDALTTQRTTTVVVVVVTIVVVVVVIVAIALANAH